MDHLRVAVCLYQGSGQGAVGRGRRRVVLERWRDGEMERWREVPVGMDEGNRCRVVS